MRSLRVGSAKSAEKSARAVKNPSWSASPGLVAGEKFNKSQDMFLENECLSFLISRPEIVYQNVSLGDLCWAAMWAADSSCCRSPPQGWQNDTFT